jgi:type III secretory pathway component EscT
VLFIENTRVEVGLEGHFKTSIEISYPKMICRLNGLFFYFYLFYTQGTILLMLDLTFTSLDRIPTFEVCAEAQDMTVDC